MFLAIDIGNTHTVLGVYQNSKLLSELRITSSHGQTKGEIASRVEQFLRRATIESKRIRMVGISSVVPKITDTFVSMVRSSFDVDPIVISTALDLGIRIQYDNPASVGADRLCNAVAGFTKYGGPLIIIDFGTATTYDVVAANGDYLGGVIAPGIETSAADLHRRAAMLPKVELHLPLEVIGTNTVGSMQAGILYGALDAMEGMVDRLQKEMVSRSGLRARVLATGGFSTFMSQHSTIIEAVEPSLVLDGVRLICERQKRAMKKG